MNPTKQKHTLSIADLRITVVTDASAEDVERLRGLLDRKMREIYLKSRCPKTEAALLCALEFAADRSELQEQVADMEEKCEKYTIILDGLKETNTGLTAELERLRNENEILRSLLKSDGSIAVAPDPIPPTAFFAEVAHAQASHAPAGPAAPAVPVPEAQPAETQPAVPEAPQKSRRRVGSMFEQLSFGDVD